MESLQCASVVWGKAANVREIFAIAALARGMPRRQFTHLPSIGGSFFKKADDPVSQSLRFRDYSIPETVIELKRDDISANVYRPEQGGLMSNGEDRASRF